jgi:ATP-dependent protease ClpP protease subunit
MIDIVVHFLLKLVAATIEHITGGSLMIRTIFLLVLSSALIVSCVAGPQVQSKPQEVIVKVQASEPANVEVNNGDKVSKSMEIPNPEGSLSQLSFIAKDQAFVKIFSGLSVADVTRLWNDLCVLEYNTKIRDINLFINSPGGDAFSGLALADQLERAKRKGFRVTAHASGIIASAAVPVFAVCNNRLAAPGTIFMVHEAALWKWPGRETASDIRSQNELMGLLRDRYIDKLVQNSKLPKDKWEELETKTTWFDADKAKVWGLVDVIE